MNVFFKELYQHNLPSLQCSEDDCFVDFCFAKKHQTKSSRCLFSIISKCHANSDGMYATMGCYKETAKVKGLLGTVVAFSAADEEQARKTLHRRWQIWVKEINQTVQKTLL
jgi:hypothetical protein